MKGTPIMSMLKIRPFAAVLPYALRARERVTTSRPSRLVSVAKFSTVFGYASVDLYGDIGWCAPIITRTRRSWKACRANADA